ncbi:MAG: hypothetical protein E5W70_23715 [Mesorhizobium sp.]|uniref:hypothetical protein n=1 Tax=Mesorhizobium sp. TaxID=1871066 RepID=UPI0011F6DCE1|nr:hypothetical protein [Mesorhizobium sp.]TIT19870.1 MAG: hypothetical protein E5W70_23715 [Mesorhizobium sp.]
MKADIFFPEKLPAERGSAMHEGGRLALKRDQQKWNPVLARPLPFSHNKGRSESRTSRDNQLSLER